MCDQWGVLSLFSSLREKLRELNNELLKKNAFIDDMEPKYNASSEYSAAPQPTSDPHPTFHMTSGVSCDCPLQANGWMSWKRP